MRTSWSAVVAALFALIGLSAGAKADGWRHMENPFRAVDVSEGWAISDEPSPGGCKIYRFNRSTEAWEQVAGGALRISSGAAGTLAANDEGRVFKYRGGDRWDVLPEPPSTVAGGRLRVTDIGDGWVVAHYAGRLAAQGCRDPRAPVTGNGLIFRCKSCSDPGFAWVPIPGGAVNIGGPYHQPWIHRADGEILTYGSDARPWKTIEGRALDVGAGWVIGTNSAPGGKGIWRWRLPRGFQAVEGGAVRIGGDGFMPWVANDEGRIFRWIP